MKYINEALNRVLCEHCKSKITAENFIFTIDRDMCQTCIERGEDEGVKTTVLASVLRELMLRFFVERKMAKTYSSESEFEQIFEKALSNLRKDLTWTDVLAEELRMDPEMQDLYDRRN